MVVDGEVLGGVLPALRHAFDATGRDDTRRDHARGHSRTWNAGKFPHSFKHVLAYQSIITVLFYPSTLLVHLSPHLQPNRVRPTDQSHPFSVNYLMPISASQF
jgi:hypothetical protein